MEFEKAESIKGEIHKKIHKGKKKGQGNCDETKKGKQRYQRHVTTE